MSLLAWFNLFGLSVFAFSGVLTAVRKKFDPIGVVVISTVTAMGGGTIRDLLLGIRPVSWVTNVESLLVILITTAVSLVIIHFFRIPRLKPPFSPLLVADALGLGLFAIGGTQIAENQGTHWLISIVMGAMTGSAGGVIRDVLTSETPLLFRQTELYATAAIVGCGAYLILENAGIERDPAALVGMAVIFLFRLAAIRWNIKLPVFRLRE
jgi:uncharacterized membrane protein YeiH